MKLLAMLSVVAVASAGFAGCASKPAGNGAGGGASAKPVDVDKDMPFSGHPSPAVRGAAEFGGLLVGCVVGIPASIVLVPVTYPLAAVTKDKWAGLYPFGVFYFAGGALFGGAVAPFVPSTYRGEAGRAGAGSGGRP